VPVKDARELTLTINTDAGSKKKALFLANARLVTSGRRGDPARGSTSGDNVEPTTKPGEDLLWRARSKSPGFIMTAAIPAQPADPAKPAILHIPLAGKDAVRFKATLGGDFPFGDESESRKVYAIRSTGTEARFITVLEPYENEAGHQIRHRDRPGFLARGTCRWPRSRKSRSGISPAPGAISPLPFDESKEGRELREETADAVVYKSAPVR